MKVSNCCGASFYEPGWPDNDICSACKEHAHAVDDEEPENKSIFDDFVLVNKTNIGDVVVCDGCNGPYEENIMGGAIIGSSAYCGECCDRYGYNLPDYEYKNEISEILDEKSTFKENVLNYRKRMTGSSDGIMRIYTAEPLSTMKGVNDDTDNNS